MDHVDLMESFLEFKEFKNIDRVTLMRIMEDVFRNMVKKKFGTDENVDVINVDKGDFEIWRSREIVYDGEVEDPSLEIAYSEAIKIEPDFEIEEEVSEAINIIDFGRRSILALRQNLVGRILELDKENIYQNIRKELVKSSLQKFIRFGRKKCLIDDEGNELILPKSDKYLRTFIKKEKTQEQLFIR